MGSGAASPPLRSTGSSPGESCCLRPQGCSWISAGNALSPHPGLCFGMLCHDAQPVPNKDEPIHLHPCDCTLCPVSSKWICAKHVVSSQQRSALGCSGEPICQRAAQMSPALWSRPAFPPSSPPINSQLCLGSLSLRILHGGPHISLINKVRKTGPLRKS